LSVFFATSLKADDPPPVWPDAPISLEYDGVSITWDEVLEADSYELKIYDADGNLETTISTSQLQYTLGSISQEKEIELVAKKQGTKGDPFRKKIYPTTP
jgi:hypothetical protein